MVGAICNIDKNGASCKRILLLLLLLLKKKIGSLSSVAIAASSEVVNTIYAMHVCACVFIFSSEIVNLPGHIVPS